MKKFFKILGIIVLVLIIILFTAPVLFKGKIVSLVNEQLKQNLNANASFSDVSLSFFRHFPNLSIRIGGLSVVGIEEFEGDTLASIKSVDISVDVVSAIKMENIEVKHIVIDKPFMNAIVLKDGTANWDIVPETEEEEEVTDTTAAEFTTKIALKLFRIDDARIHYTDYSSGMNASLDNFGFSLKGDLGQDFSALVIDSETERLNFTMDGIRYLKNVLLKLHIDVDANLKESIYKLNENSVALNALVLSFDGSVEMPESGDIITNLDFKTNEADFKTLLSLVPAIYMTDFEELKTTGKLKLDGKVSGAVTEEATPNVDLTLAVKDATFSYPDLPKTAKDIQIDVAVHYDGVQADNTTVDVNRFHIDLGGNPIDLKLNLRNPETDPFTNGTLKAALDLATITDIIPLEDTELRGIINASLDWMGKLSSIENEQYEDFKADGNISITNLYYNSPDVPKALTINKSIMSFSPKALELVNLDAKLGGSDFVVKGKLTNYIPYLLDAKTVQGKLSLVSHTIDVNEFMESGDEEEVAVAEEDTAAMAVIEVPRNIDFIFNASIGNLKYDKLDINDVEGYIYARDGILVMENLSMKTLDGSLTLSGDYNTQDLKNPLVDLKINAQGIDIPKSFAAFDVLGKIAPIAKNATGKVSLGMSFTSLLKSDMTPVMNSISGDGRLASDRIGIKGGKTFTAIGQALKTDALNDIVLNNVDLKFEIQNGTLQVDPFETKMGDVSIQIGGEQTFDNTLNYDINLLAPRSLLGLENPVVNNLYSQASASGVNITRSETVDMLVKVTGALTDPKVTLNLKENVVNRVDEVKEEVKEAAKEVIEEKTEEIKEDTKAKAREEADKIMKEAEKQADQIRKEAKKSADAVRWEANNNANKLLEEAKNPIAKRAAEPAAKKIRDEGEEKAKKIESEADTKATKILQDAQKRADALLK